MCGIFYYCFTRSENFLVFSVNQWNCILRSLSEPTKFWKNTLVIYLDFVFVVNLLIHNLILYSVFKVHFKPFGLWWRIRGSNPWPPACKAGALPAELIPHMLVFLRTYCVTARSLRYSHTPVCSVPRNSRALYLRKNSAHSYASLFF